MFLSETMKYLERTRALYLASLDRFRDSMLKEPDPGPNYAKLMDEYSSKVGARLPAKIIIIPEEPDKENKAGDAANVEKKKLNNLEVVQQAHYYFNIFKGLIVDLIFSFHERDESRDFFENLLPEDALRVIEVELNFINEVFYTKIQVVHSVTGYIMRFMSFGFVVAAFSLFNFKVKKHNYDKFDVRITYILFWGAIGLDTLAFFMLVFSDWTFSALRISNNESKLRKKIKSRIASLLSWFLIFKEPKWYECQKHSVEPKHEVLATPFLFRRWSGYVSGYNLIRYCIKGRPNRTSKQIDNANNCFISDDLSNVSTTKRPNRIPFLGNIGGKVIHFLGFIRDKIIHCLGLGSMGGVTDFVDEIKYVSHEPLTKELWNFIFDELIKKSWKLDLEAAKKISSEAAKKSGKLDPEAAKKISSASEAAKKISSASETAKKISSDRGDWILQEKPYRDKLLPYVTKVAYDGSLLLWHIATELLYHEDHQNISGGNNNHRQFSKVLSDYMLYLLVMQPGMMSTVAGIGKIRFRDTCAETKRFLKRKSLKGNPEKEAYRKILDANTYVKPVTVKGDRSKSVLFDASILAKELKKLEDKWELLSKMWVELLSYAACNCSARTHAQQVSKGGELITFVWLLMVHFGLGDQFQINKGQGRAKLIVTK